MFPFDTRTTVEVEASRSLHNRKPFRSKAGKAAARATARKVNGTFHSSEPFHFHDAPRADQ